MQYFPKRKKLFSIIITGIVVCGLSRDPIIIFVLISDKIQKGREK